MFFLDSYCEELAPVIGIVKGVITLIQWGVPILLIVFGTLDLAKAVIAGKEDEMKKAQSTLIRRVIYAVAVFLVVQIAIFATGLVGAKEWQQCWEAAGGSTASTVEGEG